MSISTEDGEPICRVRGGESDGEIIFLQGEEKKTKSVVKREPIRIITVEDEVGKLEQLPSDRIRCLYLAGPAGSGKSTYVSKYVKYFLQLNPNSKLFLFSRVKDDPAFIDIPFQRVILDETIAQNPIQLEEVAKDSLVVFDDIDTISDATLLKSVLNFQAQLLEMGRHLNVKTIITSHLINSNIRSQARTVLNEMQSFTFFPQSGSLYAINYCLKHYFGFSPTQIKKLLKIESRYITIIKNYPQIILAEQELLFVSVL